MLPDDKCVEGVCHSTRVDSKFGSDKHGKLNTLDKPFSTIKAAIKKISKKECPSATERWIIFLSPCTFPEDVKVRPFIDLHGMDRTASVIKGKIDARKLHKSTDQVELKELTVEGNIEKPGSSKGSLTLFEVAVNNMKNIASFSVNAGSFTADSCAISQETNSGRPAPFYIISEDAEVKAVIRNCRHERVVTGQVMPRTVVPNYSYQSTNVKSTVTSKANIFVSRFTRVFLGLLIPYDANVAAGTFNSHSDTLRQVFDAGAGNNVRPAVIGLTYVTAFVLLRKILAVGKTLEIHIHTADILGIPEKTLNTFASAHTELSGKAKTKHTGWQGFREIPDSIIITGSNSITVAGVNQERSMTGAASDNKLFASRLALQTLTIIDIPPDGNLQGPSVTIPDNVGFVNAEQAPIILLLPFGPNLTIGQQVTFRFEVPGPILIATTPDPDNPPPFNTNAMLQESNIPGTWQAIVFNILPIKPPQNLYPAGSVGIVEGVSSATFTLVSVTFNGTFTTYLWKGVSTPSKGTVFGPGKSTVTVPSGAQNMTIIAWGGGGAGGRNGGPDGDTNSDSAGAGGGSAAGFQITTPASGISSVGFIIGQGSKTAGQAGIATQVSFSNTVIVANPGQAGGEGITFSGPAIGGIGGDVIFSVNGVITPPPANLMIFNGVSGGNAGPLMFEGISTGNQGTTSATGYLGGFGGSIRASGGASVSGPGGGAGGFNGRGATAASFIPRFGGYRATNDGADADAQSGAGGAGEGPASVSGIANGGDGGAVIFFT